MVELSHRVAEFYFGGIQHYDLSHLQSIVDMYSDAWFWYTVHDWGQLLVRQNVPTWQYMFRQQFSIITDYILSWTLQLFCRKGKPSLNKFVNSTG